jgi:DNA-binding transcriptional LysR family regulator
VPSVITGIMPKALVALQAKYPGLHVELTMGLSKDLVERVHRGTLDAAIVSDLREGGAGLTWSPFASEPLVLMAPLAAPRRRAEELISVYPFIRYTRQAWVGQLIDRFLKDRGLRVREAMTLDTLEAITTMVHHGLGVSVVPLRTTDNPVSHAVRTVPFAGPSAHRVLGLVRAAEHPNTALSEALLGELKALMTLAHDPAPRRSARAGGSRPHP